MFETLKIEAANRSDCHIEDDYILIRIDEESGNVCISADMEATEIGGQWPWTGTIADYLAERAATNNWTCEP